MHVLSIQPVAHIVLAAPNRVQPGLPQSMLPNFVEEWKRPGARTSWGQFFSSLSPAYQDQARQDYQQYRSQAAQRPADPVAPEAPNLGGPMGEQDEFNFMENPQQFLQRIRDGVNQFGRQFNTQTIRPYNNTIQHALRAVKSLSQQPDISPDIRDKGEQLLQMFQQIQAGDAEDAQLVQQLGQLAYQLGQSAGAYQPGAASNMQTRGLQPQASQQQSFWQRMNPRAAETILTAESGSAARLLQ